jgi:AGZA family xanthine/uracil permease-like MFS transporter
VVQETRVERFFEMRKWRTSVRIEVLGGVATFLTMCYILFVNPTILAGQEDSAGNALAFNQVLTVTALGAGVMTILMGVVAKKPFALAPGMGLNVFVAFSLVLGPTQLSWPEAMGVIVAEGLVITLFVLVKNLREKVLNAIPADLKRAIGIGIGLFITLIGLVNAGVVVKGNGTIVSLAPHFRGWPLIIFAIGLLATAAFVKRGMRGALLYGILFTTVLSTVVNAFNHNHVFKDGSARIPQSWVWPDFGLVGAFSFHFWSVLGAATAIAVVASVMLSDFFDTAGTGYGISAKAGMLDENDKMPGAKKFLLVDSLAAAFGGAISSSSITTYVESASGVAAGARTGLASVVTGVLFLAALILAPVAGMVPAVATAPVLVIVGYYMFQLVSDIHWNDPLIGIPALLTIIVMPATYSITNGVGVGFVSYTVLAVLTGNAKRVHPLMYIVTAIFGWYFWHGVV